MIYHHVLTHSHTHRQPMNHNPKPQSMMKTTLSVSLSEEGQKWEEVWRAKVWESSWVVPVTHFDAGIHAPGRPARFIKLETKADTPHALMLQRVTVYGVK